MPDEVSNQVYIGRQGRVVVPAPIRKALDIKPGERMVARTEGERLVLERPDAILTRVQRRFRDVAGGSMVDELIAERRAEARREREADGA